MTGKLTIRRNFGSRMVVTRVFWWDAAKREAGVELCENPPDGYRHGAVESLDTLELILPTGERGSAADLANILVMRSLVEYNAG